MSRAVYTERMHTLPRPAVDPRLLFALLALALVAAEAGVVRSDAYARAPELISGAVVFDLLLTLPALFWLMLVRTRRARPQTTLAALAGGALVVGVLLPEPPAFLNLLRVAPAAVEVGLLAWGALRMRAFVRALHRHRANSDDLLESVRLALDETPGVPPLLAGIAAELTALWYGLCAFRTPTPAGPNRFAYHESFVALLVLGFVATPAEGLVVHVLLNGWSPLAAWIATALHVYGLVWLIAFYQGARLRPVTVTDDTLLVRWSLLWTAEVPRARILTATALKERPGTLPKTTLDLARLGDRYTLVELDTPITLHGPLGLRRTGDALLLAVEDGPRLAATLGG